MEKNIKVQQKTSEEVRGELGWEVGRERDEISIFFVCVCASTPTRLR